MYDLKNYSQNPKLFPFTTMHLGVSLPRKSAMLVTSRKRELKRSMVENIHYKECLIIYTIPSKFGGLNYEGKLKKIHVIPTFYVVIFQNVILKIPISSPFHQNQRHHTLRFETKQMSETKNVSIKRKKNQISRS